jgi:hypothetical protein
MKRTLLTLLVLVVSIQAKAQSDNTEKLLDATRVDRQIVLSMVGQEVRFSADNGRKTGVIATSRTFAGTDGFILLFHNFNPLAMSIAATQAKTADPVTKGSSDFLDLLSSTLKLITPSGGSARGTPAGTAKVTTCSKARQQIAEATQSINDLESQVLDASTRTKWVTEAVGLDGVKLAQKDITQFIKDLNGRIADLQDNQPGLADLDQTAQKLSSDMDAIRTKLTTIDKDQTKLKAKTSRTAAETTELKDLASRKAALTVELAQKEAVLVCWPNASDLRRASKRALTDAQKLSDTLKALLLSLGAYVDETKWSAVNAKDYIVLQTETEPDILNTITVKISTLTLAEDGTLQTKGDPIARDIILREYRRFVPEFGVAAVYNDLRYPKYISKDGKVAANGFDTSNINAAMTMNLLCNCFGGHFVYPGLQLGVSKAKDYPGLMGGIAFRFAGVKRMAFSAGRMVSWYKDLDKLKIGDSASDNDIKADLKLRRARTAFYLAAQFTF